MRAPLFSRRRATLLAVLCAAAVAAAAYVVLAPSARRIGAPQGPGAVARPATTPPSAPTTSRSSVKPNPRLIAAWRNRTYTTDCHRLAARPFKARVRDGRATAPGDRHYRRYAVAVRPVLKADLTGDGRPETAVLLTCRPYPGKLFVQEVQLFTRNRLLTLLPDVPVRAGAQRRPVYDRDRPFTITNGHDLAAPMGFYAPTDVHAGAPSLHRTVTFHWTGITFVPSGYPNLTTHPDLSRAVVTTSGLGPLRIGMSFGQVSDVLAQEILPNLAGAPRCITVAPTHLPPGVSLTFNLGELARINVQPPSQIATESAIRIGSGAADVERAYPQRITNSVRHGDRAMVYTLEDPRLDRAIAFVQDGLDEPVTRFRVGTRNAAFYDDLC
jgi:hypothetical protein